MRSWFVCYKFVAWVAWSRPLWVVLDQYKLSLTLCPIALANIRIYDEWVPREHEWRTPPNVWIFGFLDVCVLDVWMFGCLFFWIIGCLGFRVFSVFWNSAVTFEREAQENQTYNNPKIQTSEKSKHPNIQTSKNPQNQTFGKWLVGRPGGSVGHFQMFGFVVFGCLDFWAETNRTKYEN